MATFGFNRTALRATQPKLHSMFRALFLKIAFLSRRADVVWTPRKMSGMKGSAVMLIKDEAHCDLGGYVNK